MKLEIDVSGGDLLSKNYVICVASDNGIVRGFKFGNKLVKDLCSRYGQGIYRYKKSKKGKSTFKLRLYSVVIYYFFKSIEVKSNISLNICRDFQGRENDIKENLNFFLNKKLRLKVSDRIYFTKLPNNSLAHKYAFLMRHDNKNKLDTYIEIPLKNFEKWLKK